MTKNIEKARARPQAATGPYAPARMSTVKTELRVAGKGRRRTGRCGRYRRHCLPEGRLAAGAVVSVAPSARECGVPTDQYAARVALELLEGLQGGSGHGPEAAAALIEVLWGPHRGPTLQPRTGRPAALRLSWLAGIRGAQTRNRDPSTAFFAADAGVPRRPVAISGAPRRARGTR